MQSCAVKLTEARNRFQFDCATAETSNYQHCSRNAFGQLEIRRSFHLEFTLFLVSGERIELILCNLQLAPPIFSPPPRADTKRDVSANMPGLIGSGRSHAACCCRRFERLPGRQYST